VAHKEKEMGVYIPYTELIKITDNEGWHWFFEVAPGPLYPKFFELKKGTDYVLSPNVRINATGETTDEPYLAAERVLSALRKKGYFV